MTDATLPVRVLEERFNPRGLSRLPPDVLEYVLFLPSMCLACGLAFSLRLIGSFFVVMPVFVCLLYAVLRLTTPPRLLSAFVAFCIFIAILSEYHLMPTSWQVHFMEPAIIRQLIPLLGYFAVAWASKAYFRRRLLNGDIFLGAPVFVILSFVVGPAIMLQQGLSYQGDDPESSILASYGSFINHNLIASFFVMGGIFMTRDWRRYAGLAFVFAVAATTHFVQFRVFLVVVLATLFGASGRVAAIVSMVMMVAVYAIGSGHIPEVILANQNSGIRLAFVSDAISSAIDTFGIGIGYGKESVKWQYNFPNMPVFTFLPDPMSMTPERMLEALSTGVENSFVESLLRTGVIGLMLFLATFIAAFPPRNLPPDVRNHAAVLFTMSFLGLFVNSALESPLSAVGHGFLYGYLLALRAHARIHGPAMALGPVRTLFSATPWFARPPPAPSAEILKASK
jgi:hypothetical protein